MEIRYDALAVREDLRAAHERYWERLRQPGPSWTGAERVAIARETRQAVRCTYCRRLQAELSPYALAGEHDSDPDNADLLSAPAVDAIHRIVNHASRLTRSWYRRTVAAGLAESRYVELVGTVVSVLSIDRFCHAVGVPLHPLPEPEPGEASGYRPAGAMHDGQAWVPMVPFDNADSPEADLWPAGRKRLSFEKIHAPVLDLVPESAGCVLDVGAGSGRDAAWFAAKGHRVVAVEPSAELRAAGKERHGSPDIRWMDDALPALDKVLRSKLTFDLIWLSAVWMHVPPSTRARAFRKLVSVMSPGGSMMLSLRHGPPPPGRPMAPATAAEVEVLARRHGLQTILSESHADAAGRIGIWWVVVWLRLPDDGTGALPLLRHVVFNDRKSSTYKLALLRALIRIADGAGGFARSGDDAHHVDLPLGLVALFWVRAFRPLIAKDLPQHPAGNGRLAFVKDGFRGLEARSPHDLRVGQQFTGDDAQYLIRAVRDAARCIRNMPATYIKYPGSSEPIFPCKRSRAVHVSDTVRLDEAFLWSFGTFSVPVNLWRAMSRFAPWLEPAVLAEWIEIMRGYASSPASRDAHMAALRWLEPEHDTGVVRTLGRTLRNRGSLFCVWTGRRLRDFDIDHCFPFAAWPCNDLWNLVPSSPTANRRKGDLLPAPDALEQARLRMLEWWDLAYLRDTSLARQFEDECRGALPTAASEDGAITPESLFEGVMIQQMVLKRDQQLAEWMP